MNYIEYTGQPNVLLVTDRDRDIVYNGEELKANTYQCSSCGKCYVKEIGLHKYCPNCGCVYDDYSDISI